MLTVFLAMARRRFSLTRLAAASLALELARLAPLSASVHIFLLCSNFCPTLRRKSWELSKFHLACCNFAANEAMDLAQTALAVRWAFSSATALACHLEVETLAFRILSKSAMDLLCRPKA